jgi:Tfp pilus assembly protein PilW
VSPASKSTVGFTLVELLIGMSLALMIMGAVLSSYTYMGRGLYRLVNQQTLQAQGRNALAYFAQDVRMASGLTDTGNLSATRVSLTIPAGTATNTITYYYNNTPNPSSPVSVNGTNVTFPANSFTRCVYNGSTLTTRTLLTLRNINDTTVATRSDLTIRYYDASGNEYTSYTNYLSGIKQLAIEFSATNGNYSPSDTASPQTATYQVASPRLVVRNRPFLQ